MKTDGQKPNTFRSSNQNMYTRHEQPGGGPPTPASPQTLKSSASGGFPKNRTEGGSLPSDMHQKLRTSGGFSGATS